MQGPKTIIGWLALAFVVWYFITDPGGVGNIAHNAGTFLSLLARDIGNFFAKL